MGRRSGEGSQAALGGRCTSAPVGASADGDGSRGPTGRSEKPAARDLGLGGEEHGDGIPDRGTVALPGERHAADDGRISYRQGSSHRARGTLMYTRVNL